MEDMIRTYLQTELLNDPDLPPLQNDTSLLDSNLLDSVSFLDLVLHLETAFGISVADSDLTKDHFETINAICAYVRGRQQPKITA